MVICPIKKNNGVAVKTEWWWALCIWWSAKASLTGSYFKRLEWNERVNQEDNGRKSILDRRSDTYKGSAAGAACGWITMREGESERRWGQRESRRKDNAKPYKLWWWLWLLLSEMGAIRGFWTEELHDMTFHKAFSVCSVEKRWLGEEKEAGREIRSWPQ